MAWEVGHRLQRDGASQPERVTKALVPEHNPIDARTEEDFLLFLYRMAGQFAYYNARNEVDGDWRAFFAEMTDEHGKTSKERIRAFLRRTRERHDNPAFMTILLAFLKLFRHLQDDINKLTKEHLEFYFQQVLDFHRLPPKPDEVHVLFELAPQADQHLLPSGTALKAGKDARGRPLTYLTNREIVVNKAQLAGIKTVLVNDDGIYAAEVANSADGLGAPLEGDPPKWATFGDPFRMQRSTVGFAIASPLLLLQEGERTIHLTLTLSSDTFDTSAFQRLIAQASGEKEWLELSITQVNKTSNQLTLTMVAGPEIPAITRYNPEMLDGKLMAAHPVLRLLLHPHDPPYKRLKGLTITSAELTVSVRADAQQAGVRELVFQNDYGRLDAGSAFQPFGATPARGSRFYIGSSEVFSKPLDSLDVQLEWADLPDDANGFAGYYGTGTEGYQYPEQYRSNSAFTVSAEVLSAGKWQGLSGGIKLFNESGRLVSRQTLDLGEINLPLVPDLPEPEAYDPATRQGFVRLTLEQDFGHRLYPKLFAELSANPDINPKTFPNAPYTPTLQSISLGYTASQKLPLSGDNARAQFFQIFPFGALNKNNQPELLPPLPIAALYLGIAGLEPPQHLHLLFQVAEGSAATARSIRPENIEWHYLTAAGWRERPLKGSEIFIDTTMGLQRSGIVAFNIGGDASKESTLLPGGYHWLRARLIPDADGNVPDPAGVARSIAIHTQAATAVFQDYNNDPGHLQNPLPANRISGLVKRERAIRTVTQPYASFGGTTEEQAPAFYARVSERLRHKQRAITLWDIERLVLQQFPQLYEAKVIPHTGLDIEVDQGILYHHYSEFCPGQLTVVVIPKLRNQNAVNPLQPMASDALREEVRRYLLPLAAQILGDGTTIHVINPRYEEIQVSCSVGFREGYDGGYYAEELNKALQRYLSPWAFKESPDIKFRNWIYKSQLLAFVEELPYVDYVTDFEMRHGNPGPGIEEMGLEIDFIVRDNGFGMKVEVAEGSCSASILVSKEEHLIRVLQRGRYPCN